MTARSCTVSSSASTLRTGKVLNTLNLMPHGCLGDGIWGSPAIDASHNVVYFVTGNAATCLGSATFE